MAKFANGLYYPNNTAKYIGKVLPRYRSSWEKRVMIYLDENPNVIAWGSELIKIPYKNPLTGKIANYIPDLMVKYQDKAGNQRVECIEIKPLKETLLEFAKSKNDQIALTVNHSKWQQAQRYCQEKGISFRILTERDIFGVSRKK